MFLDVSDIHLFLFLVENKGDLQDSLLNDMFYNQYNYFHIFVRFYFRFLLIIEYSLIDDKKLEGKFVRLPERSELNADINESLIVEFYNR